jgi:acetyl-CoA acetyltransferase family protein
MSRIAIIHGYRTATTKAGGGFNNVNADDLGAKLLNEMATRSEFDYNQVDEVIIGNVAQPAHAANIARVITLKAGLSAKIPAFTVHRNCASGMEALTTAACKIKSGEIKSAIVGGVESMSNIPFLFQKQAVEFFINLSRAKTIFDKIKVFLKFKLKLLKPIIGLEKGLTDPTIDMIMGQTAEILAKEFSISRKEQDKFALSSHKKAAKAIEDKIFENEIIPIFNDIDALISEDEGVRKNQNKADLEKLRPYFEKETGTVTVGNSSQITDGACFMLVMSEEEAKKQNLEVLGYLSDFSYSGLDPKKMGLGPAFAIAKLLDKSRKIFEDIDLFEINEAFSVQVLACVKALDSKKFAKEYLEKDDKIGKIDENKLNINGGGIALGHPVGMTGARIILHALNQLKRTGEKTAIASLCIGGGQGGACLLERN